MRFLFAIGVPILIGETCFFFLTIGSEESNQYQYCNKTECTYEASADYANCKSKDLVEIPPQCSSAVYLDLRQNDLQYIESTSFSNYKNVKYLYLDGNHIKNITPRAFVECTSLQQLFLQNNPIFIIYSEALAGLTDLRHLYLNLANLQIIQPHAFDDLKALVRLYLSDNSLGSLPLSLFQELQNLEILTLANNRIRTLSSNTFQGLVRLEYLDIKQNSLTLLPNGLFHNMLSLTRLTISFNSIHTIEKGAIDFDHLPHLLRDLGTLDMRNNSITSVANFSTDLPAVPNLYLANNPIHCDCHNINGLLIWYEDHPGVDGPGTLATCNSPPEFAGRLVRDITPNITLPCEQTPTPPLPDTPPARTIILKMPYDISTKMQQPDFAERKGVTPDMMYTDTTSISSGDFKGISFQKDDKDATKMNVIKYVGIGLVVATTIIVVILFLLVLTKCKIVCKKKHETSNSIRYIPPLPDESQPENPYPNQSREEERVYEQVPGFESTSLSNQESPPTTPESPGTDESFPFLPPSPSQAPMPQKTPLPTTGYISLPSIVYPHNQQSVQYKPMLMHSISEPLPSHPIIGIRNPNSNAKLPDVTHTISQEINNLVHPYAMQLVGQHTQMNINNMNQNTQMDHNFDTVALQNPPLPYHQVEAQTPPVPLPDIQQGSCRCPISHLPYTNPFCAQNTMQIQNNPICT